MNLLRPTLTLASTLSPQMQQKLGITAPKVNEQREKVKEKSTSQQQRHLIKQEKIERNAKIQAAVQWLIHHYPVCFNYTAPRPLKLRIENDIFYDLDIQNST